MKTTAVAVTLIILGTLLCLAPMGADYFYQRNVVDLHREAPAANVVLIERLNNWYRVGCWLPGGLMIILGILASLNPPRPLYDDDLEEMEEGDGDAQQ